MLSIAAKVLEKPRNWEEFLGLSADSLSIWTVMQHVTGQINPNDLPSTVTKKAIAQVTEDIKKIVLRALGINGTQIKESVFASADLEDRATITNPEISPSKEILEYSKKRESICDILSFVSDAQTMTGE